MIRTISPTRASVASIDFESRSTCDLRKCGSWKYSLDPSTQVLCLAFRLPHWPAGKTALWHPAFPTLKLDEAVCPELPDLFQWIRDGGLIEAHNSFFERGIWQHIMVTQYGWPAIPAESWRCSAAKAAAHALPRALDDATKALGLSVSKDMAGHKLMLKLSKPRKPRKAELQQWEQDGRPILWWESVEWFEQLWAYCRQDILAEEALSQAVPDLPPTEVALYVLDQQINETGVRLDQDAITAALTLIAEETVQLNTELAALTNGQVQQATQRARLLAWLASEGLTLDNTQKQTVDELLALPEDVQPSPWLGVMTPTTRRALAILRDLGKSSTAKYDKMRKWACADGRMHGTLLYHGASTGRWSGAGPQPHNFPKGTYKEWDMEDAWFYILNSSRAQMRDRWESVMAPLSQALRGVIIPSDGKHLFVADYAAIEARVVLWLAGDDAALNIFREGRDIYCDFGTDLYGRVITKADTQERQVCKISVLGLSYGMGASKFTATCEAYGVNMTEDFAQTVVDTYRERFSLVKRMWYDQEDAAIQAVQQPGRQIRCGRVSWLKQGKFLYAILPSGRRLAYPFPQVKSVRTPWDTMKPQLSFMGISAYTHQWQRQSTYGGSLVENCLAGHTPILTRRGWIRLDQLKLIDWVWDGVEWVWHDGLIDRGWHDTCILDGLTVTPDHRFLTTQGWRCATDLHSQELEWAPCGRPRYYGALRVAWRALAMARRVCSRAHQDVPVSRYSDDGRDVFFVSGYSGQSIDPSSGNMGRNEVSVLQHQRRGLSQLWRAGHHYLRTMVGVVRQFLGGYGTNLSGRFNYRPDQQRRAIQSRELSMGDIPRTSDQYSQTTSQETISKTCGRAGSWAAGHIQPVLPGPRTRVYDIRNCGPRHQFVVAGGRIAHNCTQAVSRDCMAHAMQTLAETGVYTLLLSVHDELVAESDPAVGSVEEFTALVTDMPTWADGCPIAAESWSGTRYAKH